MIYYPSIRILQRSGIPVETKTWSQPKSHPETAKKYGGYVQRVDMNGKLELFIGQTDMDVQFVQERKESDPPKMKMHPLYCIGGATY